MRGKSAARRLCLFRATSQDVSVDQLRYLVQIKRIDGSLPTDQFQQSGPGVGACPVQDLQPLGADVDRRRVELGVGEAERWVLRATGTLGCDLGQSFQEGSDLFGFVVVPPAGFAQSREPSQGLGGKVSQTVRIQDRASRYGWQAWMASAAVAASARVGSRVCSPRSSIRMSTLASGRVVLVNKCGTGTPWSAACVSTSSSAKSDAVFEDDRGVLVHT